MECLFHLNNTGFSNTAHHLARELPDSGTGVDGCGILNSLTANLFWFCLRVSNGVVAFNAEDQVPYSCCGCSFCWPNGHLWTWLSRRIILIGFSCRRIKEPHFDILCDALLLFSPWIVSNSLKLHGLQQCQASLSFTISWSSLKLMSIELMPSDHLIFCHPLLLLPSIFPSIRVFSNESALHIKWPKY